MKRKVQINDSSIETAGLPTDYKEAICEFIWNAFDVNATSVKIEFDNSDIICGLLRMVFISYFLTSAN